MFLCFLIDFIINICFSLTLQQYQYTVIYIKGAEHSDVDCISRNINLIKSYSKNEFIDFQMKDPFFGKIYLKFITHMQSNSEVFSDIPSDAEFEVEKEGNEIKGDSLRISPWESDRLKSDGRLWHILTSVKSSDAVERLCIPREIIPEILSVAHVVDILV